MKAKSDTHRIVRPLKEYERRLQAVIDSEGYDCVDLTQNTEVGDHWKVVLNLERWRTADELAKYLRTAAKLLDAAKKH